VEKAAKLFKQAGCVQSDIKAALTSHIKHDEIDIPQDEPEEAKKVSPCSPPPLPTNAIRLLLKARSLS